MDAQRDWWYSFGQFETYLPTGGSVTTPVQLSAGAAEVMKAVGRLENVRPHGQFNRNEVFHELPGCHAGTLVLELGSLVSAGLLESHVVGSLRRYEMYRLTLAGRAWLDTHPKEK